MDKDFNEIMESLRAFMQSPEYAQMQDLATQYKSAMDGLNEALRPQAEALQQFIVELYKVMRPIIEELQHIDGLFDGDVFAESQYVADIDEPITAWGQLMSLSKDDIAVILSAMGFYEKFIAKEMTPLFGAIFTVLLFCYFLKKTEGRSQNESDAH